MARFIAFLRSPFVRELAFSVLATLLDKTAEGLDRKERKMKRKVRRARK